MCIFIYKENVGPRRGQLPRQTGSKDTPVRTFDSAGFIGRHGQYPVSSLNITSLDLPCYTEAWTLVCEENINMDKEKWKGKILFQSMRQWLLPLNTSETHSLKGLSIDLWGGLKASVEEREKTSCKYDEKSDDQCLWIIFYGTRWVMFVLPKRLLILMINTLNQGAVQKKKSYRSYFLQVIKWCSESWK